VTTTAYIYQGIVKAVAGELWTALGAVGAAVAAAGIGWGSARALKKDDVVASNLRTQLDGWKSLSNDLQGQVAYRNRQIEQYIVIIEALREDRYQEQLRLDECERGRIALYYEINELRARLGLESRPIPQVSIPKKHNDESPTC
jgi:hypothetical protein